MTTTYYTDSNITTTTYYNDSSNITPSYYPDIAISYYDREVVWARETHEWVVTKAMSGVGREAIRQIITIIPVK